jgi:AcrR family transcriptional regulator
MASERSMSISAHSVSAGPGQRKRLAASARREQILEAATELFIARGFEGVGMADIAQALQISRPAVYSYFTSTESILDALLQGRLQALWSNLAGVLPDAGKQSLRPQVGVYAAVFEFLLGERETLLLLHSGGGPGFQARRSAFLAELGRRLEAHYPNTRRGPQQMLVVTHLLGTLAHHAVQQHLTTTGELAGTLDSFLRGGIAQLTKEFTMSEKRQE